MANRKVLINRHTSTSGAPIASEMFKGEIAVAHKTGEEILWTKNNDNEMVPFISCAQTMTMINNAISDADVTYDVKAANGDAHVEVASGGTEKAKVFTVSSKDVMSEEEFKAYSARTAEAVEELMNMLITAVTGEGVIEVEPETTGATGYNIKHKEAKKVALGFNKVATDDYGHVIDYSAVTADDINAVINIAELSAATKALSAGTQHDIEALSGDVIEYVNVVSGNIETVINSLSAGTKQLSADTHNKIESVYGSATTYADDAIAAAIDALDSNSATTDNRHYVTAITIEDGKITSFGEAADPQLSVESAGTGNVVSQITVDDHKITYQTVSVATSEDVQKLSAATVSFSAATDAKFAELSAYTEDVDDKVKALSAGTIQLSADTKATIEQLSAGTIMVSGYAHGEIVELSGAVQANETDIDNLSAATLALSAVTITGVSLNNTPLAVSDHVVTVPVADDKNDIAGATATGNVADAKAVKEYVENLISSAVEYKGATGATPSNPAKGDLYIASSDFVVEGSKSAETGDFIIYDGTKWDVIEKNLDGAITGNLTQDTVTLGDSTNSVRSLANGANGTVLTIVNGVPAWANDPELTVVSAGTGNVISNITVSDHEITFTKGVTAADDADLQALSGVVREFSATTDAKFIELSAYTKDVDDKVKALSAGTIQLSADTVAYVDAQIDDVYASAVSYADSAITYAIEGLDSVGSASTTGHYLTSVTITDGKISAVGEVAVPAAVAITATTGAAVDTPSAVLTGVTADGTDNHNLTFGMSNKVFSAASSDSALTAVHADAASKVDSALTINIIDSAGTTASTVFDGSANQTINITNTDTATTEAGHYAPATAASAFTAPAGSFLSGVSVDSKNHVLEVAYADKINSATTSESADTAAVADKVANALSISGYSDSSASSLDTAISYDGSAAQALTFGTVGNAGLNSMSMTSAGLVDVEVIDCGEY